MPYGNRASYTAVDCTYENDTEKAVLVTYEDEEFWVARSRIHGGDERLIDGFTPGEDVCLRIETWICEKNGMEGKAA